MHNSVYRQGSSYLLSSPSFMAPLGIESFDVEQLDSKGLIEGRAEGRGGAWFIQIQDQKAVLRHYYRGGWAARISSDKFLWLGLKRCRAIAEYRLLHWMLKQSLPVPVPLGACVTRDGLSYSCDLLTRVIPNTKTLAAELEVQNLESDLWRQLGKAIRRFHDKGVWHADLNAKNILLDGENVFLIDFDRCKRRTGEAWKKQNLQRLLRSLHKLANQRQIVAVDEASWKLLLQGYIGA